jgi:hypothetical protein
LGADTGLGFGAPGGAAGFGDVGGALGGLGGPGGGPAGGQSAGNPPLVLNPQTGQMVPVSSLLQMLGNSPFSSLGRGGY